jgi:hypothetical protein
MKTRTKTKKIERLTTALLKLSRNEFWEAYVCDDRIFTGRLAAAEYARELSEVRGEEVWISKVHIPACLPLAPQVSYLRERTKSPTVDELREVGEDETDETIAGIA